MDALFKKTKADITSPLGIKRKKISYALAALKRNADGTYVNEKRFQTLIKEFEENEKMLIYQRYGLDNSDNTKTNSNNGRSVSKKCEYCGIRFSDIGYSIYSDEIIEGKYKDPWVAQQGYEQFGGKGKIDNVGNYCTRKCAVKAYNSGARGK
jgi:hypothetical protein